MHAVALAEERTVRIAFAERVVGTEGIEDTAPSVRIADAVHKWDRWRRPLDIERLCHTSAVGIGRVEADQNILQGRTGK